MKSSKAFWPVTFKYAFADLIITCLLYIAYATFEFFAKQFPIDGWAGHMMHVMHSLGVGLEVLVFGVLLFFNVLELHNMHFIGGSLTEYFRGKAVLLVKDTFLGFFLWFGFWVLKVLQIKLPVEGYITLALEYGYGAIINLIYAIIPLKFVLHIYSDYKKVYNKQEVKPYANINC
jgi:hypothetical protein